MARTVESLKATLARPSCDYAQPGRFRIELRGPWESLPGPFYYKFERRPVENFASNFIQRCHYKLSSSVKVNNALRLSMPLLYQT